MKSVFYLASDLSPVSSARQLARIAAGLDRARFCVQIGALRGADSPLAEQLRAAGIPVHAVPIRNAFDWSGQRRLKRTLASASPAIVHAWGSRAVRSLAGVRAANRIASDASFVPAGMAGRWTVRSLRHCDRVVPASWSEAERYRNLGVRAERLTRIAPGVEPPQVPDRATLLKELQMPASTRFIVAAGNLEPDAGFKSAIWAFDLIRYEFPALHLAIIGDGPERDSLNEFARALMFDDMRVRFISARADLPRVLALSDFAWLTNERGDVYFALEAMAAGVPVIGWKLPPNVEVIEDGRSGILVEPNDRAQLAAKTYPLLTDAAGRESLGQAGRDRAIARYSLTRAIEHYESLYEEVG